MLALIPLFPFLGFLVNAIIGRRLSKSAAGLVACAAMVASFAVALTAVIQVVGMPEESRHITQTVFTWIASGNFTANFTLRVDPLSSLMICVSVVSKSTAPRTARCLSRARYTSCRSSRCGTSSRLRSASGGATAR